MQHELPSAVWQDILRQLSVQQCFVVSMVCSALRSHALSLLTPDVSPDLEVCLTSGVLFGFSFQLVLLLLLLLLQLLLLA
jgi:hypothetical protein